MTNRTNHFAALLGLAALLASTSLASAQTPVKLGVLADMSGIFSDIGGMGSFDDTFKNRIAKFVEQVSANEPLIASGYEGLAAQEVIEAAIRSFENGTVEEVPAIG